MNASSGTWKSLVRPGLLAAGAALLTFGIAASGAPAQAQANGTCGTLTTAAGLPAVVKVQHGPASCHDARNVLSLYYSYLSAGLAPGNGGGGPVKVLGWVCQSPPYTERDLPATCVNGAKVLNAYAQPQAQSK
ncbi:hypothetical protein [Kitasatospora sp. GP82]|uniref:hypothetical protein n=1 Tax=Kitasatospora sp. GP82 TaxID=3035089 RepID=UPI00247513F2|nr:hypothetical protein [Kitasatospora sp. GP82]MDH6124041.1 hypothetical protein [Kitasatospora sp. GP82]